MSAKCKECGGLIFPDDGPCFGTEVPAGSGIWVCDECLWTKHCLKCHKFIPDDYTLCDFHLRDKYGLLDKATYGNGWGSIRLYPEATVLAALRAAERHHDH